MNRNHIEEAIFVLAVVNEQMILVRLGLWVLGLRSDSIFLENFKLCFCIEKNFVLIQVWMQLQSKELLLGCRATSTTP